ncbi:beta-lactamase family protein [Crossiella sp. SN42]|uniref:serine hydrolase domain-containing protein n=1 Tax=Crossiella sp. SN42 TaxID=2944808 RepID=UPI00207CE7AA|nr:serine hydrolase domain-containing protein [Crossiella sp. SN42]MCO1580429.1 beta-lactamase family protein [Crossiella sp. SN42]
MIKRLGRRPVAAALAALAAAGSVLAGGTAHAADGHADTQALLNGYQSHAGPGAAVYAGNRSGSWHLSAGTASITGPARPIRPDEHFRVGSQTKTFTAAVVLQLVDEGKVALDEPIERYLPGLVQGNGYDGNRITVRQLLQHTGGVANPNVLTYAQQAAGLLKPDGSVELRPLVEVGLRTFPPVAEPGAKVEYSNLGYMINGLLVEQLTGVSIGEAITSRIINRLGLTRTTFPGPGDRSLPAPYLSGYRGVRAGPFFFWTETTSAPLISEPSIGSPAGAVLSSLADLSKFYRAVVDGGLFSAATGAEMRRIATMPNPADPRWLGIGLGVQQLALSCGGHAWFHNGIATSGYTSLTAVTEDGRHASMMTNAWEMTAIKPTPVDVIESALCGSR